MSDPRSRSGLLSRLAAPLAGVARRMSRRAAVDEMTPAAAELEKRSAQKAARDAKSNQITDDDFHLAMEQLLHEDQGRFGIKLHVVSLVEFREGVGERWSKVSDKVMMIAEGVVAKHLGIGNLSSRQGSDFFTLLFRTCDNAEAGRRAHAIAQELGVRLVGDQFQGAEMPLALSAELDLSDAMLPDGTLNHAAIHRAVGEKRSLMAGSVEAPKAKTDWSRAGSSDPIAPRNVGDLPHSATADVRITALQDPGWVAMDTPKRAVKADPVWNASPEQTSGRTIPGPPPVNESSRLSLLWRPTWTARDETIGAYAARLQRLDGNAAQALEGSLAYPHTHQESVLSLDRFGIAGAVRDFRAGESAGLGSTVIIPIHWRTLTADNRMEFLAPFADLTEQARQSRLVVDLFGIPADVHARTLAEVVAFTKPLCREVVVRASLRKAEPAKAADCGASMIGLDLSQLEAADRTGDDELLNKSKALLELAAKSGLGVYLWGVRRRALVVGAVHGGFAMINGPALMKDLAKPAKTLPAPKARFTLAPR